MSSGRKDQGHGSGRQDLDGDIVKSKPAKPKNVNALAFPDVTLVDMDLGQKVVPKDSEMNVASCEVSNSSDTQMPKLDPALHPIQETQPRSSFEEFVPPATPERKSYLDNDSILDQVQQIKTQKAKDTRINELTSEVSENSYIIEQQNKQLVNKTQEVEDLEVKLKQEKDDHKTEVDALNTELETKCNELSECKEKVARMEREHDVVLEKERKVAKDAEMKYDAKTKELEVQKERLVYEVERLINEKETAGLRHKIAVMRLERDLEIKKAELRHEIAVLRLERDLEIAKREVADKEKEVFRLNARLEVSGELHDLKKEKQKLEMEKHNLHSLRKESQAQIDSPKRQISESPQPQQKPSLNRTRSLPH